MMESKEMTMYTNLTREQVRTHVLNQVCRVFGCTLEQLRDKKRTRHLVNARSVVSYLLYENKWTLEDIGEELGGRDHTTVLNQLGIVKDCLFTKQDPFRQLEMIRQHFLNK